MLPIPYEATISWGSGTGNGPHALIRASHYVEWYDEELDREPCEHGICTLPSVELSSSGPEHAVAELRQLYADLLEEADGRFVLGIGGEHSLSSAPATAWIDRLGEDVSILQFDAHADLREEYHGTPWNHACVMRRILERTDRIVQVGIRALTTEEAGVIRQHGLTAIYAHEMRDPTDRSWIDRVIEPLADHVYITFDVDFFDPSIMPATGTPEPGGGSWWDALDILKRVFAERTVVGADIVELADRPGGEASAFTAAKLAYKVIGLRGPTI